MFVRHVPEHVLGHMLEHLLRDSPVRQVLEHVSGQPMTTHCGEESGFEVGVGAGFVIGEGAGEDAAAPSVRLPPSGALQDSKKPNHSVMALN